MKIISWNINSINAITKKNFFDFIKREKADIYCFQELKANAKTLPDKTREIKNYHSFFSFAEKKGYSGVACYSKKKPIKVTEGIGVEEFDKEGRVLTLEFNNFFLINTYFPNAGSGLKRLDYKLSFNKAFAEHAEKLKKKKNLIITGDLNIAHKPKDLANPESNENHAGYTPEEREWFSNFLNKGYVDTFREFKKESGHYTFWTYRHNAREKNIGWRLDYFVVNKEFMKKVKKSEILKKVKGSDHCPIKLILKQ